MSYMYSINRCHTDVHPVSKINGTYSIRISIVYALNIKFTEPLILTQWHDDSVNHLRLVKGYWMGVYND